MTIIAMTTTSCAKENVTHLVTAVNRLAANIQGIKTARERSVVNAEKSRLAEVTKARTKAAQAAAKNRLGVQIGRIS